MLHWVRRAIELRRQHPVFGQGALTFIKPQNRKIFAFTRSDENETVLCVFNLSRSAQPVELDLHQYKGLVPVELAGNVKFPQIGSQPYQLSFNEYGFFRFLLT